MATAGGTFGPDCPAAADGMMAVEVTEMFDTAGFVVAVAVTWVAIGVVLSVVMGRRGHNAFAWLVLGAMLGPLAVLLAVDAARHDERTRRVVVVDAAPATVGPGPVDVLVGYDGSPESAAAFDAAVVLFGDRLGRLTAASVVPFGDVVEARRRAEESLRDLTVHSTGRVPGVELLQGHPSSALVRCALDNGYDVIAVGTRGAGITKALLGSAAAELSKDSRVPVLLVGGQGVGPHEEAAEVAGRRR